MRWPSSITWGAFIAALLHPARAYIPATAANNSAGTFDDNSTVSITWNPNGAYSTVVSYQQHGSDSSGISKGALVRVQEEWLKNGTWGSDTPWIALIQCDFNSTPIDLGEDIFTKVRDRGALAALLYSNSSDGCVINDEYTGEGFSQIFDIFTTKKSTTAILIQSQFSNVNYSHTIFNSTLLNASYTLVSDAIPPSHENKSPYLVASLRGADAGAEDPNDGNPLPSPTPTAVVTPHTSDPSQSLAMIILYVIVSLVSTLFLIVIISGAIRAFRHPERYGPRLYDPTLDGDEGQGQTRAAGLTRAILDTFPVVKFGRQIDPNGGNTTDGTPAGRTGAGAGGQRYEMKGWDVGDANRSASSRDLLSDPQNRTPPLNAQNRPSTDASSKRLSGRSQRLSVSAAAAGAGVVVPPGGVNSTAPSQHSSDPEPLDPAAIGRETCPICIVDFEEGDDLRVLPCEGKHRFHKDCVDPWLLELSSSCPICREDFQALENMAAANTEQGHGEEEDRFDATTERHEQSGTSMSRFTRYIRFAQKRRRSQRDQNTSTSRTTPYTDY